MSGHAAHKTVDGSDAIGFVAFLRVAPWLRDAKKNSGNKVHHCADAGCDRVATHLLMSSSNEMLGAVCLTHGCAALRAS